MSQENVEIIRRAFEAWVRRDLDTLFEFYAPEIEWDNTHREGWIYYGHEGVRGLLEAWLASSEGFEAGADEYLDSGGDQVLLLCWHQGSGPGRHAPVRMDWALLCTLEGGLCRRVEAYSDRRAGLDAAGLSE